MDKTEGRLLQLIILQVNNNTYQASIKVNNNSEVYFRQVPQEDYDGQGALYYVVAVLCIYAFSIILMIGSSIKKSRDDNSVSKYMKGMDKLRKTEKRQQKFKARMMFHQIKRRSSERSVQGSIDIIQEESENKLASVGENSTCDIIEDDSSEINPNQEYCSVSTSHATMRLINEKESEEVKEESPHIEKQRSTCDRSSSVTSVTKEECSEETFV